MGKVVINACHGGFGLSCSAMWAYADRKGWDDLHYGVDDFTAKYLPGVDLTPVCPKDDIGGQVYEAERGTLPDDAMFVHFWRGDYWAGEEHEHGEYVNTLDIARDDPDLIAIVEEMGERANGRCSRLEIVEIPDGVEWQVEEYDGMEWVAEQHRTWP